MEGFVKWVEGAHFFARPRAIPLDCTMVQDADWAYTFSSCRFSAAGSCVPPYDDATWTGDSCVCATLDDYNVKFSECIYDTPYSDCIDDNNSNIMSDWSTAHCEATTTTPDSDTPVNTPGPSTAPVPISPPDAPSTTPPPPSPIQSSTPDPEPSSSDTPEPPAPSSIVEPEPTSEAPQPTNPPSTLPAPPPLVSTSEISSSLTPEPSSEASLQSSEQLTSATPTPKPTPISTPSVVPKPSLVPVTIAPHVTAETTGIATSTSMAHIPVPKYSGSGKLLQGYCATPEYTIIDGPTAYWLPIVGCVSDKPDCCPFDVAPPTQQAAAIANTSPTITTSITTFGSSAPSAGNNGGFPNALSPAQATLNSCPDDYSSIGDGCCPSSYFPWSTDFGGQTPCYSTLAIGTTPPPIPDSLINIATTSPKPTSAIVNVVYAMQYPVKAPSKPALNTNAKIGIGVGAGGAALAFGILIWLLLWKHRAHKRDKAALESLSGFGPGLSSTRQSVAASSAVGGVKEWRQSVPGSPGPQSRFHEGLEPTLPNVAVAQYPANWHPGQRTRSPPIPHPYQRSSMPSPPIPEGYSEVDSQHAMINNRYSNNNTPGATSDGGLSSGNRSELHSGEYFARQELQGVPEEQHWSPVYHQDAGMGLGQQQMHQVQQPWSTQPGAEGHVQQTYYEAPAGRMTPMGPPR